jgi:hypothetical protein
MKPFKEMSKTSDHNFTVAELLDRPPCDCDGHECCSIPVMYRLQTASGYRAISQTPEMCAIRIWQGVC